MLNSKGVVYLVGAGPGDPALLTVRARELLDHADIVAYDELISPSILATIKPSVKIIPIGYRGYGSSKLKYELHPVVIEMAKLGKNIVRLKSGDPFIFGRGSQECQALINEQIRYEIVPGISSGLGAATYAGFPLTHRDYASDVSFTSGHDLRGGSPTRCNWKNIAESSGTIVIYMASSKIKENCERLVSLGRHPETPAIYIANATCGNQKIIEGTLRSLFKLTANVDNKWPALIIVGEVIKTREIFDWRRYLPLSGKQILVVRVRAQDSELAKRLRSLGADVIEAPFIETTINPEGIDFKEIKKCHQFLFSDEASVRFFFEALQKEGKDLRFFLENEFIAFDKKTMNALRERGVGNVTLFAGHCEKSLAAGKLFHEVVMFGSSEGRMSFADDLKKMNTEVIYHPIYNKKYIFSDIKLPFFDGVVFASSSAVDLWEKSSWNQIYSKETIYFSIGNKTYKKAQEKSIHCKQSADDTVESLLQKIVSNLGANINE